MQSRFIHSLVFQIIHIKVLTSGDLNVDSIIQQTSSEIDGIDIEFEGEVESCNINLHNCEQYDVIIRLTSKESTLLKHLSVCNRSVKCDLVLSELRHLVNIDGGNTLWYILTNPPTNLRPLQHILSQLKSNVTNLLIPFDINEVIDYINDMPKLETLWFNGYHVTSELVQLLSDILKRDKFKRFRYIHADDDAHHICHILNIGCRSKTLSKRFKCRKKLIRALNS